MFVLAQPLKSIGACRFIVCWFINVDLGKLFSILTYFEANHANKE